MSMDMFEQQAEQQQLEQAPLATRMRPNNLNNFVGQEHILGKGRVLRRAIESDRIPSVILWGPPGCGKTTLAYIIANSTGANFSPVSAVTASVGDLRRIVQQAKERRKVQLQR
jgi:putative ATPase